MTRALVVFSGGQDSTTCLYIAKKRYEQVLAITFDYGQRHAIELRSANCVAAMAGISPRFHKIVRIPHILESFSPLTSNTDLEQYANPMQMVEVIGNRIEKTFVPMRNQLFLTIAMNYAVATGCTAMYTGVCQEDNANYPDCRRDFIEHVEIASNIGLGTACPAYGPKEGYVYIHTPLMDCTKADTVKLAHADIDCWRALMYTHTSYAGDYPPLDQNHATVLRADGFAKAGLPDPLILRAWSEGSMLLPIGQDNYLSEIVNPELRRLNLREWT